MKDIIKKINDRVVFAEQNKEIPFVFNVKGGYNPSLTDAKDKHNAQGDVIIPSIARMVFDEDGTGAKQKILIFNGNDDIFNGEKINTNERGRFEEPNRLPRIKFVAGKKLLYGDSLKNLNLIKYLSYLEFLSAQPFIECTDITKEDTASVKGRDILKMIALVDKLAETEDGFKVLVKVAKDGNLNEQPQLVDGLAKLKNGKDKIIDMFDGWLMNQQKSAYCAGRLTPNLGLVKECIEKGHIGFNKATKSFQPKEGNQFTKDVIFTTNQENDAVRSILLGHFLVTNEVWKVKLKNMTAKVAQPELV